MVQIGKYNRLTISKERSVGYFFDGGEAGDILMPKRHQPEQCAVGDTLDVFVFLDAEERLTATVRKPYAQVDEVAWLRVVDTHAVGAFMDWGLTKDLLVPYREQAEPMSVGEFYLVHIHLDDGRIVGSSQLDKHLKPAAPGDYKPGQKVRLLLADDPEDMSLGVRGVVNHRHWGMLYLNEIFEELHPGQRLEAYVKKVREDGRLDLSLRKPGYHADQTEALAERILKRLRSQGGQLALGDKSPPEAIHEAFGVSKKAFKQAVGQLYKARLISVAPEQLKLNHTRRPKA